MASPSRSREEAATCESPSSCKNIQHPSARVGCHQAGTRPPEPLLSAFPEASRSLFPQLFLQGHRRRVGGQGRQRRAHVDCLARIWEFGGRRASLAEGPVCALGLSKPQDSTQDGETEAQRQGGSAPIFHIYRHLVLS